MSDEEESKTSNDENKIDIEDMNLKNKDDNMP